jgi:hypothetical protein
MHLIAGAHHAMRVGRLYFHIWNSLGDEFRCNKP